MAITAIASQEQWKLAQPFKIARGVMTQANVVLVELSDGTSTGRGESCPTAHYGESVEGVLAYAGEVLDRLRGVEDWTAIHDTVRPGAARNAIDCAWWDLRAKRAGRRVWTVMGLDAPEAVDTVYTISLDVPEVMADAARAGITSRMLKLKLGAPGDIDRVAAVRRAVPSKRLIVDVNEGWSLAELEANLPKLAELGVEMIEQPLPAGQDAVLAKIPKAQRPVPIGADESCHTAADVARCVGLYDVVNIKLDKTGGLTEALRLLKAAEAHGLQPMVGCMIGTSLAMAPAQLVAQRCRYVDLDAPLLIGHDRANGLRYVDGTVGVPTEALWG